MDSEVANVNAQQQAGNTQFYQTHSLTENGSQKSKGRRLIPLLGCGIGTFLLCLCVCVFGYLGTTYNFQTSVISPNNNQINETSIMTVAKGNRHETKKIAVIDISGPIDYVTQREYVSSGSNNVNIEAQLTKAQQDKQVNTVILRFNTPGGVVVAAEPICNKIKEVRKNKKVFAFIDTEAASLGYLLSNCTDKIYSRPEAITGSIGVRADLLDLTGILTNLGAKRVTITNSAGKSKSQEGLFDSSSVEYKQLQSILDETYEYFIKVVIEGRRSAGSRLSEAEIRKYADGRIFSGIQAESIGLVDEIGQFDDVINSIIQESPELRDRKVEIVEYNIVKDPFRELLGYSLMAADALLGRGYSETKKIQILMVNGPS